MSELSRFGPGARVIIRSPVTGGDVRHGTIEQFIDQSAPPMYLVRVDVDRHGNAPSIIPVSEKYLTIDYQAPAERETKPSYVRWRSTKHAHSLSPERDAEVQRLRDQLDAAATRHADLVNTPQPTISFTTTTHVAKTPLTPSQEELKRQTQAAVERLRAEATRARLENKVEKKATIDIPARLPAEIQGYRVEAWAWIQREPGNGYLPNGIALGYKADAVPHPYAVWYVTWRNGQWDAGGGSWRESKDRAWAAFVAYADPGYSEGE